MRIDILTVVPELLCSPLNESILKRARSRQAMPRYIYIICATTPTTAAARSTTTPSAAKRAWS